MTEKCGNSVCSGIVQDVLCYAKVTDRHDLETVGTWSAIESEESNMMPTLRAELAGVSRVRSEISKAEHVDQLVKTQFWID